MELVAVTVILAGIALGLGSILYSSIKVYISSQMAERQVAKAAISLLESDDLPTKNERAIQEVEAKMMLRKALAKHESNLRRLGVDTSQ